MVVQGPPHGGRANPGDGPMPGTNHHRPAAPWRARLRSAAAIAAVVLAVASCTGSSDDASSEAGSTTTSAAPSGPATAPVAAADGWFVDGEGRVVQLRGVNEVFKAAPFYPAADGFGPDDAQLLRELGFNTVRLGVNMEGLMPEPGKVSTEYLDGIAQSVDQLQEEGLWVVMDFHQDGFSPKYNGNGFPDWMAIDDGLENPPDAVFPLYYVQNPAMQRAWEHFWADDEGPDGVGVQTHFHEAVRATAERFASAPNVIGYEAINEPFPGADYQACLTAEGCGELEAERITPFAERFEEAVRSESDTQLVWVEPFVLFNFGQGPTTLPGAEGDRLLAAHTYALSPEGEEANVDYLDATRDRDDKPVLITEFGASMDPALLDRHVELYDEAMVPWLFWAYNENIVHDREEPASLDTVVDAEGLRSLVRPYPSAVAGVPTGWSFDADAARFELSYSTGRLGGGEFAEGTETVIEMPPFAFPDGYRVEVEGGEVTSDPCAPQLTIAADAGVDEVQVTAAADGADCTPG
jgi:endoglycosylceramidase